jgi:hypothetical protein
MPWQNKESKMDGGWLEKNGNLELEDIRNIKELIWGILGFYMIEIQDVTWKH